VVSHHAGLNTGAGRDIAHAGAPLASKSGAGKDQKHGRGNGCAEQSIGLGLSRGRHCRSSLLAVFGARLAQSVNACGPS
jgi:hypothetical protein